jgi:uncharacterized membrane protein YgcG
MHHRLILGLVLILVGSNRALAVAPEVKDEAKFFSADTVKKANHEIREIARKFDKDFLIETVSTVPADQAERVKMMSAEDRERFFENWANDRAEAAVVNGMYLLVCKDPAHLHLVVAGRHGALDNATRAKIRDQLLAAFRQKKFDEGLMQAIATARERLEMK